MITCDTCGNEITQEEYDLRGGLCEDCEPEF